MNCEQALILISAALDGEITRSEREQLNSHLDLCADCRALAEDFGILSAALAEEAELPAGLTGRMQTAVKAADRGKKRTFLRRYGSMAAMLALVVSLGAIALSGGRGMNDAAMIPMFDAKMEMADAAPAAAAPAPSTASYAKGSADVAIQYVADSAATYSQALADADSGYDVVTEEQTIEEVDLYGGSANTGASSEPVEDATPLQPPAAEEPQQFDPPDHAVISYALEMVMNDLAQKDGLTGPPVEEEYYYCVLERTDDGKQTEETRLEYTGLSPNGKYLTFSLDMYTVTASDSPAQGAEYITHFNNFAVSTGRDEVLREYDAHRSAEHVKLYRKALDD